MVPLVDNFDYYHGGKYTWLRWTGHNLTRAGDEKNPQVQEFYNVSGNVWPEFKKYIHTLLTHVNPHTNLSYAQDATIFAIETGNELCGPVWGDMDVPADWVKEVGKYVKSLAPQKLFVDGTYGVNQTHLNIEEIDIFSNHYYPVSLTKLRKDLELGEWKRLFLLLLARLGSVIPAKNRERDVNEAAHARSRCPYAG